MKITNKYLMTLIGSDLKEFNCVIIAGFRMVYSDYKFVAHKLLKCASFFDIQCGKLSACEYQFLKDDVFRLYIDSRKEIESI